MKLDRNRTPVRRSTSTRSDQIDNGAIWTDRRCKSGINSAGEGNLPVGPLRGRRGLAEVGGR